MYDPKFSQKQMYDQYGSSRKTTTTNANKQFAETMKSSGGGRTMSGIGAKPPSFPDNNPNRDEYENKSVVSKVFEKTVDLLKSFGAKEPEALIVDGKRVYQGPAFAGYTPTLPTENFGGDYGKQRYFWGIPQLGKTTRSPTPPTLPPSTINMFGTNTDNPRLNMFGVERGSFRDPDPLELSVSPEMPSNMDAKTRALSQGLIPTEVDYTIKEGDTLSEIAKERGTTVQELQQLNNIPDSMKNKIFAGDTIRVPVKKLTATQAALRRGLGNKVDYGEGIEVAGAYPLINALLPLRPDAEGGYDEVPQVLTEGLGSKQFDPVAGAEDLRFGAGADTGSDVSRSSQLSITNSRGNYSQTKLTNAIDKSVGNENKKALLKGAVETEIGNRGLVTEATGYRLNRAYEMFNDDIVDAALESLSQAEQTRIRNGAASNALGLAIMDRRYDGGSDFRGRGLVQLTHRRNYQAVQNILESNGINIDLVGNPDLANDTRYALPIAMAYLDYAGLDNTTANNSSAKDLNNRINAGAGAAIAEERWENVVSNLSGDAATRMENRNEYAAQRTVGTTIDGIIGPNSRTAMREWLSERNITIPQNATDMDLVVLINENS